MLGLRPDARGQAEVGVVGQSDRCADVGRAEKHGHRAENFLTIDGTMLGDIGKHGGFIKISGALKRMAAHQQACTGSEDLSYLLLASA